uniref:PDZ domain-containing protein n=1 Tax=Acrobeloides nanus TaxID=290746 RepID=A0A914BW23_9BILA
MTRDSEITPLPVEPSHETVNSSWLENSTKGSNNFNTIAMPSTSSPTEVDANGVASPSSIADTIQADELDESLEQIEISKKEIDQAVQGPHSPSNNSILLSNKKLLKIPCEPDKLPFSIKGGADNAELFHVDTVLHPDILDKLSAGDILLSVNKTEISGMIQKEVLLMLKSVYSAQEFITIEYIPAGNLYKSNRAIVNQEGGKLSTDILKILRDKNYMDLQSVIRDNIYRDMVPST